MVTEPTELTGKVVNGVIVLEDGEKLPDDTIVRVEPIVASEQGEAIHTINHLREMLLKHAGTIEDRELPTDLSVNIDHYLYGTPKR